MPNASLFSAATTVARWRAAVESAGTIRPDETADDFFFALTGIWHLDLQGDWQRRLTWLLDLVMDGLRANTLRP